MNNKLSTLTIVALFVVGCGDGSVLSLDEARRAYQALENVDQTQPAAEPATNAAEVDPMCADGGSMMGFLGGGGMVNPDGTVSIEECENGLIFDACLNNDLNFDGRLDKALKRETADDATEQTEVTYDGELYINGKDCAVEKLRFVTDEAIDTLCSMDDSSPWLSLADAAAELADVDGTFCGYSIEELAASQE